MAYRIKKPENLMLQILKPFKQTELFMIIWQIIRITHSAEDQAEKLLIITTSIITSSFQDSFTRFLTGEWGSTHNKNQMQMQMHLELFPIPSESVYYEINCF